MDNIIYHEFLVRGESLHKCKDIVTYFLHKNMLAKPFYFEFIDKRITRGDDRQFQERIKIALKENENILSRFILELKKENFNLIEDIMRLPQGYLSKTFHTIAHFLDGFFGIDAYFYNLIEDSYFVSNNLMQKIFTESTLYYIISVEATYRMKNDIGFEKKGSLDLNV